MHQPSESESRAPSPRIQRDVVSYVRRSARMNPSQQRAWEALHHRWVVDLPAAQRVTSVAPEARIDPPSLFGRQAPLLVEGSAQNFKVTYPQDFALAQAVLLARNV